MEIKYLESNIGYFEPYQKDIKTRDISIQQLLEEFKIDIKQDKNILEIKLTTTYDDSKIINKPNLLFILIDEFPKSS